MKKHVELLETLNHLSKRKDSEDVFDIINVVVNLLHETAKDRITAATYKRTFKHKNLIIDISYGDKK